MTIRIDDSLDGIDWAQVEADLAADDFDNGRSPNALRRSFEQSPHVAIARDGDRVVGTARLLSDGVCNAYLLDVWTASSHRRQGVATAMVRLAPGTGAGSARRACRPTTGSRSTRRSASGRSRSSGRPSAARGSTTTRTVTEIRPCRDDERAVVLEIVNAAAEAYRGAIPADRWHEPYMSADELDAEIAAGVAFRGYEAGGELLGVMGIQRVRDVDLIRHAYVRPSSQRGGVGSALLAQLRGREPGPNAGRHVGGGRVGDPLLRAPRLRARPA